MDAMGRPLMAEWHSDLRFRGSPVLRNAEIPTRNRQDIMTTLPIVLRFDAFLDEARGPGRTVQGTITTLPLAAFLSDEARVAARFAPATRSPDQPHPAEQPFQLQLQATRRLVSMYDSYMIPIMQFEGPYFTHTMMDNLQIRCAPLDLITGDIVGQYLRYFRPMEEEVLNFWIHANKTDVQIREYKTLVGIDGQHENNYTQAMSIWKKGVAVFLSDGVNHDHLPKLDHMFTTWNVSNNGYRQLHRREGNGTNWSAEGIFHFWTDDGSRPDDETPHVVAFVADQAPLMDGLPSTSAVQTAIWLAASASAQDRGQNHNIFPVAVVCCSGHKVRVVQMVINLLHGAVEIRLSQIVDLRDPPHGDWTAFLQFLCWFLPDPTGDTTSSF
ncbi:unnamed protein product [Clonostachys byssicola]|uniref:Uncharacterized protein n=1 Tax=Clonostachys byssicola TaxID=160290 RepID=A0A9N9UBN8_9HYPO|nr:unnamed protein product [Clonostachys byssicola]